MFELIIAQSASVKSEHKNALLFYRFMYFVTVLTLIFWFLQIKHRNTISNLIYNRVRQKKQD